MRAGSPTAPASTDPSTVESLFAGLFGLLLGVGLLKFGNPVILDRLVEWPGNMDEWRVFPWPVRLGHLGLTLAAVAGFLVARTTAWRPRAPAWIVGLLTGWLAWQFAAAPGSIDPPLTRVILVQFTCCTLCWWLGNVSLSRVAEPRVFWLCLAFGFLGVLGMAADQRFGGLAATRKMILESPGAANIPPEYLARIQSNRVFSTLVYPNALAGAVLLILPLTTLLAARFGDRWGTPGRRTVAGLTLVAGLAVLVWSGSKAGWLLAMATAVFLLLHCPIPRRAKLTIAAVVLVLGLAGFTAAFGERLRRGATSVAARFDYWSAALEGSRQRPFLGHGPGAFKRLYASVKRPESEMAQLAHNDYLQQAVDSGIPGALAYSGLILGSLAWLYRNRPPGIDPLAQAAWVGITAWFTHSWVEFGLYIPATSWIAFTLLGWLTALKHSRHPLPAPPG